MEPWIELIVDVYKLLESDLSNTNKYLSDIPVFIIYSILANFSIPSYQTESVEVRGLKAL